MSELTYTRSGDYLIPDLSLTEQPQAPLGKYGRMRKDYLKEHRPVLWNSLLLSERLYPHLREIDEAANNRLEQMMPELMKSAGVTEALKASDPMKWVGLMNTLKAQAEETILTELVFSQICSMPLLGRRCPSSPQRQNKFNSSQKRRV